MRDYIGESSVQSQRAVRCGWTSGEVRRRAGRGFQFIAAHDGRAMESASAAARGVQTGGSTFNQYASGRSDLGLSDPFPYVQPCNNHIVLFV